MFRRSPLLGAAVVYTASRSAARREVDRNDWRTAELQRDSDRRLYEQEQRMRRDQERRDQEQRDREREQEARMQRAIEAALAQERARVGAGGSLQVQGGDGGGQQMPPGVNVVGPPPYVMSSGSGEGVSLQDRGVPVEGEGKGRGEGGKKTCEACGKVCQGKDKFCGNCGNKLLS